MNKRLMINNVRAIAPAGMHILCITVRYNNLKIILRIYYVSLIKLALQFYSWNFDILTYEIFINKFQVL